MSKIKVLNEHLKNMIAAGEVVERPAGVVKELVENSIDADSHKIEVHLQNGGLDTIEVRDDGCGMDKKDATAAFGRHATSKIEFDQDLWNIHTMGFRGEALPSIASVDNLVYNRLSYVLVLSLYVMKLRFSPSSILDISGCPFLKLDVAWLLR